MRPSTNSPRQSSMTPDEFEHVEAHPRRTVRWAAWIALTVLATLIASFSDRLVDRFFFAMEEAQPARPDVRVVVLPHTPAVQAPADQNARAAEDISRQSTRVAMEAPDIQPSTAAPARPQLDLVPIEPAGPEGEAGIAAAIRAGKLRPAGPGDLSQWVARYRAQGGKVGAEGMSSGTRPAYVVTGDLTFPGGLYGAHSVVFIVPTGVPYPSGSAGHSLVLDMGSGACIGAVCSSLGD